MQIFVNGGYGALEKFAYQESRDALNGTIDLMEKHIAARDAEISNLKAAVSETGDLLVEVLNRESATIKRNDAKVEALQGCLEMDDLIIKNLQAQIAELETAAVLLLETLITVGGN